jgi:hypothetical protein
MKINAPEPLAIRVNGHRNGDEQHAKMFPARAPETTREGACAPQKSLMIRDLMRQGANRLEELREKTM